MSQGYWVVSDHAAVPSPVGDSRLFLGEGVLGIMAVTRSIFSLLLVQTLHGLAQGTRLGCRQTILLYQVVPFDEKWFITNP